MTRSTSVPMEAKIASLKADKKLLLQTCRTVLEDCEMALDGRWDRSDYGFECTSELLIATISKVTGG